MRADLRATARAIAGIQLRDGSIPYYAEGPVDPWDHIEAAMALDAAGYRCESERAYLWLAGSQRLDGSWPSRLCGGRIEDPTADANFAAYAAAGLWHHVLATGDESLLEELWPTLERAVDFALGLQAPGGEIRWSRDAAGRPWPGALLTSCSCIHLSLHCAVAAAGRLGYERTHWELAAARLGEAIRSRPEAFEDKSRYAMDWYYPVLGGAVRGEAARRRLLERWDEFVVVGLGCRCVSDRPWVTAAESSELVMALDLAGLTAEAREVFDWVQRLRAPSAAYWTGITFPDGLIWPEEQPAWTAGAVVLAGALLEGDRATNGLFTAAETAEALETVA
ncbi:MAG TPA: prenyltransferase [Candidatus Dormibacteraeota bacterium]